jgi:hypothetical protein
MASFFLRWHQIPAQYLYWYILIFFIGIIISQTTSIPLSGMMIIAFFVCLYLDSKRDYEVKSDVNIRRDKMGFLEPEPKYIHQYPNLADLFYDNHDLQELNYKEFSEIIYNVDTFLLNYENMKYKGVSYCKQNYDNAYERYQEALNHAHSLILGFEANRVLEHRVHMFIYKLQTSLLGFLQELKEVCNTDLMEKGYDVTKSPIYDGVIPYSTYINTSNKRPLVNIDKKFTFDIF